MFDFVVKSILPLLFYFFSLVDAYEEKKKSQKSIKPQFTEIELPKLAKKVLYPFGAGKKVSLCLFVKIVAELFCTVTFFTANVWFSFFSQTEIIVQQHFYRVFIQVIFSVYILGWLLCFCILLIDRFKKDRFSAFSFCILLICLLVSLIIIIYIFLGIPLLYRITDPKGTPSTFWVNLKLLPKTLAVSLPALMTR